MLQQVYRDNGRLSKSRNLVKVERVRQMVCSYRQLSVWSHEQGKCLEDYDLVCTKIVLGLQNDQKVYRLLEYNDITSIFKVKQACLVVSALMIKFGFLSTPEKSVEISNVTEAKERKTIKVMLIMFFYMKGIVDCYKAKRSILQVY